MPAAPAPSSPSSAAQSSGPAARAAVRPPHQRLPLSDGAVLDRTGTRGARAEPPVRTRAVPGTAGSSTTAGTVVVIAGVGPVFGHGLCAALEGTGVPSRTVGDTAAILPAVAGSSCSRVVVVPAAQGADVRRVLDAAGMPEVVLVLLLADAEPESYLTGLRAGARGFVPVGTQLQQIVAIVSGAARGFSLLPPVVARSLCRSLVTESRPEVPVREQEWLRQIARGTTVADLAQRSAYSEREMYRLLGGVYRRLGANNRTEALFAAQRAGLLDDGDTLVTRSERPPRRSPGR